MTTVPAIARTELFSYLVTRHTGRSVRTSIEDQLDTFDRAVLAVLDLRHVPLIDFSCADEVVAKLVGPASRPPRTRRFFLFRGIDEHHLEPIQSALGRQGLAAAAETIGGDPLLLGEIERDLADAWRAVWALGLAGHAVVADRIGVTDRVAITLLEGLDTRRLVIRDGERYVSFGRVLSDSGASDPGR